MKKILFLLPMFMLILVTGCGKNPEETVEEAFKNMKDLNNFHYDADFDVKVKSEGIDMTMSGDVKGDIDLKSEVMSVEATMNMFGTEEKLSIFSSVENNITTTYTESEGQWTKSETKTEELNLDMFDDLDDVEKVKDKDSTYSIKLSQEDVNELLEVTGEDMIDKETFDFSKLTIEVAVEGKYISKIYVKAPMKSESDGVTVDGSIIIEVNFSKFNEVKDLTIPQNVIDNAILEEDM